MKKQSTFLIFLLSGVMLLLVILFSLASGKYQLSLAELLSADEQQIRVFMTLRLPRTLMAVTAGFALGAAGMVYQTVLRNTLASPDMIGVTSGASAGAAFAILFLGGSFAAVTSSAFAGSMLALVIALFLTSLARGNSSSLILAGIAVHSISQTVLMLLKLCADPERELASIEYWIMGSLNGITMKKIPSALLIVVMCFAALVLLYRQILLLSLDEDEAALLGVSVSKMRLVILVLATLMVSAVISITGVISFVGLLAPHSARLLMKDDRLPTFFLSSVTGAMILCIADIMARSIIASELPVSVFTSLLGAPFLLFLLMRRRNDCE